MSKGKINRIEYSTKYLKLFKKLAPHIREKAREKERWFRYNPFDPKLETHKLHGKFKEYWSYSVDYKNRVIFRFLNGNSAIFLYIGPHPY